MRAFRLDMLSNRPILELTLLRMRQLGSLQRRKFCHTFCSTHIWLASAIPWTCSSMFAPMSYSSIEQSLPLDKCHVGFSYLLKRPFYILSNPSQHCKSTPHRLALHVFALSSTSLSLSHLLPSISISCIIKVV